MSPFGPCVPHPSPLFFLLVGPGHQVGFWLENSSVEEGCVSNSILVLFWDLQLHTSLKQ